MGCKWNLFREAWPLSEREIIVRWPHEVNDSQYYYCVGRVSAYSDAIEWLDIDGGEVRMVKLSGVEWSYIEL